MIRWHLLVHAVTWLLHGDMWSCVNVFPSWLQNVPYWQVWCDACRVLLNFITQTLSTLYRLTWRSELSVFRISGSWNAVKKHRWGLTCLEIGHFLEQRVWLRLLCSGFGCCLCKLGSVFLCVCLCVCICQTTHQPVCWFRLLLRDSHFLSVYLVKLTHLWV